MSGEAGRRVAVVLFNLGGPDGQDDVKPFLFNLFNDKAIIRLPQPVRGWLARAIAARRERPARANYALMGGGSPLLAETRAQARALSERLASEATGAEVRVFVAMRYWHPLVEETADEVAAFAPDAVVLLPLYPQYSTTTTASSLKAWSRAYAGRGTTHAVCCYPEAEGWIDALSRGVSEALGRAGSARVRVLFSAHGLPESVVAGGDPYQSHVERTARAVASRLGLADWRVCYQSRVGPMRWLGPSTPEALAEAADEGLGVVVVPLAFVSEHVETLVELDIDHAGLAETLGVRPYLRVPAVGVDPDFVGMLAAAVRAALARPGIAPHGSRRCEGCWGACPAPLETPPLEIAA